MASKMAEQLGIETKMVQGRRITDEETLKLVIMVYAGWINKNIVASLQKIGCNAIGLSGADGNSIPSVKRSPVPIDFGFVGDPDPEKANAEFISQLIESAVTPPFFLCNHTRRERLTLKHQCRHCCLYCSNSPLQKNTAPRSITASRKREFCVTWTIRQALLNL